MVHCQPLGGRLARAGGARAPAGSGYAVALGHARPFSACLSKSMARGAGPLTAHHMVTICRQMATGPSPVTTGYSCPGEISRQNRRVARHICLSVLARLRCPFTRTLMSYPVTARTGRLTVIRANRRAAMEKQADLISDNIEVVPVVVLSQTFPARPSSIPDVRDFVKRCLAQSPLTEEDNRSVGETVASALLEAAGPTGAINVSFRIFPDHVEVDVLRSGAQVSSPAGIDALSSLLKSRAADMAATAARDGSPDVTNGEETAFADWMSGVLRREGMTMEVAAKQLGVSVKTVSRWVGGATEPRLRDLRRIRELFGDFPLP